MKTVIDPQPMVEKIDGGWRIDGVCYFMGSPGHHITKDSRFPRTEGAACIRNEEGLFAWDEAER